MKYLNSYSIVEEGLECLTSDHLPIFVDLHTNCTIHYLATSDAKLPAWHKARPIDIENYRVSVANKIADLENRSISNISELEEIYREFVDILNSTALQFIPYSGFNHLSKLGWTVEVKELHKLE